MLDFFAARTVLDSGNVTDNTFRGVVLGVEMLATLKNLVRGYQLKEFFAIWKDLATEMALDKGRGTVSTFKPLFCPIISLLAPVVKPHAQLF